MGGPFILVAGARFARTPTGYEPVEVLLLQPAIHNIIQRFGRYASKIR